jgi:protein-ribulosamine 3-kinase
LSGTYRFDVEAKGVWKELDIIFQRTLTHLIPRLLGVLQENGRYLKPCLIHGDLWGGNIGTDVENGDPWIFDCAAYYAHNEMELGIWRAERYELKAKVSRREYLRNFEPSEPKEEWDDRNRLYSAKTSLMHSAIFINSPCQQQ